MLSDVERFIQINKDEMFTCTQYRTPCRMLIKDCIKRQQAVKMSKGKISASQRKKTTITQIQFTQCDNCAQGKENLKKSRGL